MIEICKRESRSHMVVVVGVDLSGVSEHVLARARDLVRGIDDAELHVVHVVQSQAFRHLLTDPVSPGVDAVAARKEVEALCESVAAQTEARVIPHSPVGRAADELTRIARETAADIVVVEVHDHGPRLFHHAVVSRLARTAPCSVLAIRDPERVHQRKSSQEVAATGGATTL
jgi:nucleotide-binding universal stress UspA family protein